MMYYKPDEITQVVKEAAEKKSTYTLKQMLALGFLGGAYIAIGGLLTISVCGYMWTDINPGLVKLMAGALFGVGLMLVVILGAELFTGNTSYFVIPVALRSLTMGALMRNWTLVYITNMIGALFVAYIIAYQGHLLGDTQVEYLSHYAHGKVYQDFIPAFIKGIGCNWLVSAAMWMAMAAKDISGKILGIWFPIMAFVTMGMEHSIANGFFIPLAIFHGADISWWDFVIMNLLPVSLGNIVGGAVMVGGIYHIAHSKKK